MLFPCTFQVSNWLIIIQFLVFRKQLLVNNTRTTEHQLTERFQLSIRDSVTLFFYYTYQNNSTLANLTK